MTIEEITDFVHQELTIGCSLPSVLPTAEIRRQIITKAMPWFYENYKYALIKGYYLIPKESFKDYEPDGVGYKNIKLPDEIQNIVWLYQMKDRSMFSLGINAPNLSLNMGVTNQPFLSSFVTTIGELGVYKTVLDGFSDVLNSLSKHTLKFDFNFGGHRLHILTSVSSDVVAEAAIRIPAEDLFEEDKFRRYSIGLAKQQLGRLLTRYEMNLPGNAKINGSAIKTEGDEEIKEVREEIKGQSQVAWFYMVKK